MPRDGGASEPERRLARCEQPMANTSQGQFRKIKGRQRDADLAWLEEQRRRDACPFEQAVRFLRSRRYIVAPQQESAETWFVGNRRDLSKADVVALAERLGCPFRRNIYEIEGGKPRD
jgi:hypothetical protein